MLFQGDKIKCKVGDRIVTGTVCGKTGEQPIVGGMYIIEPDESIQNDTYPFTHFVMPENQLIRTSKVPTD